MEIYNCVNGILGTNPSYQGPGQYTSYTYVFYDSVLSREDVARSILARSNTNRHLGHDQFWGSHDKDKAYLRLNRSGPSLSEILSLQETETRYTDADIQLQKHQAYYYCLSGMQLLATCTRGPSD